MSPHHACPFCESGHTPGGAECFLCAASGYAVAMGDLSRPGEPKRPYSYMPDCRRLTLGIGRAELTFTVSEFEVHAYPGRAFTLSHEDGLTRLCVLVPRNGGPARCDCCNRGRSFVSDCDHGLALAALVGGGWLDLPEHAPMAEAA